MTSSIRQSPRRIPPPRAISGRFIEHFHFTGWSSVGYRRVLGTGAAVFVPEMSVGRETGGQDSNATFDRGERGPLDVVVCWSSAIEIMFKAALAVRTTCIPHANLEVEKPGDAHDADPGTIQSLSLGVG